MLLRMLFTDDELTFAAIGSFRRVYNTCGFGLLESAYVGAFVHECGKQGIAVQREVSVPLYYDGTIVANYRLDLVLDGRPLIEAKARTVLRPEHVKQVLHCLRATDLELALLLNFGPQPMIKRFTLRNAVKQFINTKQ